MASHLANAPRTSPSWDPRRRNRNIGTPRAGHGQNNMYVVPHPRWYSDRPFSDTLKNPVRTARTIGGRVIQFFVEAPIRQFLHHCTVEDVVRLLAVVPPDDWMGIRIIVLRQPTRKQNLLNPVWGRLRFRMSAFGVTGSAIQLDALDPTERLRWGTSLDPEGQREIRRLAADGHQVVRRHRTWIIQPNMAAIRSSQLFRTMLHEIGHFVDWRRWSAERYSQRSWHEREAFAFRYANTLGEELREAGLIPFESIGDHQAMRRDGLNPKWFAFDP